MISFGKGNFYAVFKFAPQFDSQFIKILQEFFLLPPV